MKLHKIILLTIILALTPITAVAQQGDVQYTTSNFETLGRDITIRGGDNLTQLQISEKLAHLGATVHSSFLARIFLPGVNLSLKQDINGYTTAYLIEVKRGSIKIHYTSMLMLEAALEDFYTLLSDKNGVKFVQGAKIMYHSGLSARKALVDKSDKGVLDGVSSVVDPKKLTKAIEQEVKKGDTEVKVALVSSEVFRVPFRVFEGINPQIPSICEDGGYTQAQIRDFIATANKNGGVFIPAFDLLSENSQFERYTGHKLTSAEGMRFVRAIIEECAREWGVTKICIGEKSNTTTLPEAYTVFLYDIASRNNIELITL